VVDDIGRDGYAGVDVVEDVLRANRERWPTLHFELLLDDVPLPNCQLVFCRDVLQHLTTSQAVALLDKIRETSASWLLASSHADSNTSLHMAGRCRPVNLETAPYNLGKPERYIRESRSTQKRLGLWKL